ncbi:MAG TPA: prolyl oligopeptidase family serine peptidase [Puia sp.]|nr:prolyl oligopeptidase family serine peptidase [Puia sp.]
MRIGVFGWSRGGMETYLALAQTCRIKAGVIASGMADAFTTIQKRPQLIRQYELLAPGYAKNKESVLRTRSAVYWADKLCPSTPLLLLTGSSKGGSTVSPNTMKKSTMPSAPSWMLT